jgi:uncharacterized membrane protein YjgN (DUF898 family)
VSDPEPVPPSPAPIEPTRPAPPEPRPDPQPLVFTGQGREYFRIWIVNLFLSVITLGFYSPWAKVRRLQYFYRNTRLAGSSFEYHGNPVAILKGRIVGMILFGGYYVAGYFSPLLGLAAFGVVAVIMPWLLARSFRFRLFNSSYRGLRFGFHGSTASAYWVFLGLPLLSILTFFLLVPFVHQRIRRYQHGSAAYGQSRFTIAAPAGEFYVVYLLTFTLWLGLAVVAVMGFMVMIIVTSFLVAASGGAVRTAPTPDSTAALVMTILGFLWILAIYGSVILCLRAFFTSRIQNLVWNSTRLGPHRFSCRIQARRLFGIMLGNVAMTIVTLGLFAPFAQVRLATYLAETFVVVPGASLDEFVADDRQRNVSAIGEEAAEFFDLDIAF